MKYSMESGNSLNIISEMSSGNVKVQILEYDELKGSRDLRTAVLMNYLKNSSIRLRQVRVVLNEGAVYAEKGSLCYVRGPVEIHSSAQGIAGLAKKFFSSKLTGEEVVKPVYRGSGEVLFEPSFNHFIIIELENDEEIIIDNKLFFAASDTVDISFTTAKTISGVMFGEEGVFQTKLKGNGFVVLELPVPETEITKFTLKNDTLKVDGNYSLLRSGSIEYTVERTTSTLAGTAISGEGLLQVFRGSGEVWLAQTRDIYNEFSELDVNPFDNKKEEELSITDAH